MNSKDGRPPLRKRREPPAQAKAVAVAAEPKAVPRPSDDALRAARDLADRNYSRAAQVRVTFLTRPSTTGDSALARTIRGGRGGKVRLKTYLSLLWLAAAPPHDAAYPSRAWATLLDLPDPAGLGARRINDAIKWLEANGFVTVENRPGHPNRVTLLDEGGGREPYTVAGERTRALKEQGKARVGDPEFDKHRYFQIPPQFWTNGWMAVLSSAAVAMYLVLLSEKGASDDGKELWLSPRVASERYGLSSDTRAAGLDELRRAGLVTVRRLAVSTRVFDVTRYRNVYTLVSDGLESIAGTEVAAKPQKAVKKVAARKTKLKRTQRAARPPSAT